MSEEHSYHMTADQFRQYGKQVVDWIADYYERIESLPVLSQVSPGEIRQSLPDSPPTHGEPFDALLADMDKVIMKGLTQWQSPNFLPIFPPTPLVPRYWEISSPRRSVYRECYGQPARPVPNWRPWYWTG